MKKILNRLNSRRGETLLETLVATLIFTFGSIIMLSMISSAAKINDAARRADQKFYADMTIVEMATYSSEATTSLSFSIRDSLSSPLSDSANVYIAGTPGNGLYAYYPLNSAEGGSGS